MNNEIHGPGNQDWRTGKNTAQCNRYMLDNQLHCDITFMVGSGDEKQQILAHKYILISRSEVFEAMLVGPLHEHSDHIEIPDVDPASFRKLLKYMYYDQTRLDEQDAYGLLYAARKYLVTDLVRRCLQRLKTKMSIENVCIILSYADDDGTVKFCLDYIFRYPIEVLQSDGFKELSSDYIKLIISDNRLGVPEENIFDAVILWSERECQRQQIDIQLENQWKVLGDILNLIRYGRMDRVYLLNQCKKFLPQELYIDIIEHIASHIDENMHRSSESLNLPKPFSNARTVHSQLMRCESEVRPKEYLRPNHAILDGANVSFDKYTYRAQPKVEDSDHDMDSQNFPLPTGNVSSAYSPLLSCGVPFRPNQYSRHQQEIADCAITLGGTNIAFEGDHDNDSSDEDRNVSEMTHIHSVFPRRSERFRFYRFADNSYVRGKTYDMHTPDSISFLTSHDANLRSILLYGSCEGEGDYHINLEVFEDLGGQLSLIQSSERDITTDSSTARYELNLEPSIKIQSERIYTITAYIQGPPSYFGTNGIANVSKNGVMVDFISNDEFGLKLTTSEEGQFPGIVLERPFR